MLNYVRVIPRDLFNEANHLKCLGQLWLQLDQPKWEALGVTLEHDDGAFRVGQDQDDGSTYVENVRLVVRGAGEVSLYRPLNSRSQWPLWFRLPMVDGFDDDLVFTDGGQLSASFVAMVEGLARG